MTLTIRPQIFRTHDGTRLITHGVFDGEKFVCYAICFCSAMRVIERYL
jgi:hypothetical protein